MPRISAIADPLAYEEQQYKNALLGWSPTQIRQANQEQLLAMQYRLALGEQWGRMSFPKALLPAGTAQNPSHGSFTVQQFLPSSVLPNSSEANLAWSEILRFTIARLTHISPRRAKFIKYNSCLSDIGQLKKFVREIVALPAKNGHFWSRLDAVESRFSYRDWGLTKVIYHYHKMGILEDALRVPATVEADEPERDRSGEADQLTDVNANRQWQPLPLDFVAQVCWRSLRIIKSVAPTLLAALEAAIKIPAVTHGRKGAVLSKYPSESQTHKVRTEVIAAWDWRDENGKPLLDLGFLTHLKSPSTGKQIPWPPRTFAQAMTLAHSLALPAHLWMVLLGDGPRNSEAVSMRTDCLSPSPKGNFRWKGRTYKLSGISGGREFAVDVPEIIGQSILQQIQLTNLTRSYKGISGSALWIGKSGVDINALSGPLNSYVDVLGLRHLLGNENPSCHEHRFRKTLAKICALALTNAIMILKDCFGHTDAVMTLLSYIVADPTITQEVIKVQKELTIMMAKDIILDRSKVVGPGASALRERADDYLRRIGKSKFEPQDAYEFARSETFNGRSWMMVAPGVLCTAPHGVTQVATPCALGQKRHNPANCKTGCNWQLLLDGYFSAQADDTVEYALRNLQRAIDDEDDGMVAFWSGQAKTWLYRYDDVTDKWKNHPLVNRYAPRPIRVEIKSVVQDGLATNVEASS